MDSCSNLSVFLKDTKMDLKDMSLDRFYQIINKKLQRQEDLITKLVSDKEHYIRLYHSQKEANRNLLEQLEKKK